MVVKLKVGNTIKKIEEGVVAIDRSRFSDGAD